MLITLLTDFGLRDTYVGTMKGVIKGIAPAAELIDLTHEIAPQDIREGAYALATAYEYFPPGTVHVAVVDPGVGTARRPIAAQIGGWYFVGPNNGILSYVVAEHPVQAAVVLDNAKFHAPRVSRTFHGRDIFAPAAAALANGIALDRLGSPVDEIHSFAVSQPLLGKAGGGSHPVIKAHIIYIDRFGNAITDLSESWWAQRGRDRAFSVVTVKGVRISKVSETYADVPVGEPLALFSSAGRLEIAIREGSARHQFDLRVGDPVLLTKPGDDPR
jgi:S-adenosylmethionine hydrolase